MQILFSTGDFGLEVDVAGLYFLQLVVLVVEMVSENGGQLAVGEVIEVGDELIIDLYVKEATF